MRWYLIFEIFDLIVVFGYTFLAIIQNNLMALAVAVIGVVALVGNSLLIYFKEQQEILDLMKDVVKENRRILEKYGKNL